MSSLAEIKKQLTDEWMSNPEVQAKFGFVAGDSFDRVFSPVSVVNIIFYIQAFGIYLFNQVLASDKSYMENIVKEMKPHGIRWYIHKVKAFQLGDSLVVDSDVYADIDESKHVVKYCNIVEKYGYLIIKIAGESNGLPAKLNDTVVAGVTSYINKVKDAGVHFELICRDADLYKANIRIHYDALFLSSSGARIDGTDSEPVKKAVENYIKSMPFDSRYTNMGLIDALQKVEGVIVADVVKAEAQYGSNPWVEISSIYNPDAGYMKLEELNIEYIAY
ncbi:MAG: hypothetical protein ACK5MH_00615 [Bacteroidales bacterium]